MKPNEIFPNGVEDTEEYDPEDQFFLKHGRPSTNSAWDYAIWPEKPAPKPVDEREPVLKKIRRVNTAYAQSLVIMIPRYATISLNELAKALVSKLGRDKAIIFADALANAVRKIKI